MSSFYSVQRIVGYSNFQSAAHLFQKKEYRASAKDFAIGTLKLTSLVGVTASMVYFCKVQNFAPKVERYLHNAWESCSNFYSKDIEVPTSLEKDPEEIQPLNKKIADTCSEVCEKWMEYSRQDMVRRNITMDSFSFPNYAPYFIDSIQAINHACIEELNTVFSQIGSTPSAGKFLQNGLFFREHHVPYYEN